MNRLEQEFEDKIQEFIEFQKKKVRSIAEGLGVRVTAEDLLNPHDFPALLNSNRFNFEDGILAGLVSVQMLWRQLCKAEPQR